MLMCKQPDILESEKIHFAVMAIEAGAREMGISPMEMRRRLEKMNLIKRLLLDNYEVIHSYILIRVFHWIQWTEKEVINERTSTLEKNKSYHPIIIGPIGDKPGTSIKSVL